jgi:hypothetical protein
MHLECVAADTARVSVILWVHLVATVHVSVPHRFYALHSFFCPSIFSQACLGASGAWGIPQTEGIARPF